MSTKQHKSRPPSGNRERRATLVSSLLKRSTGTHRAAQISNRSHLFLRGYSRVVFLDYSSARGRLVSDSTGMVRLVRCTPPVCRRLHSLAVRRFPAANAPHPIRRDFSRTFFRGDNLFVCHSGLTVLEKLGAAAVNPTTTAGRILANAIGRDDCGCN